MQHGVKTFSIAVALSVALVGCSASVPSSTSSSSDGPVVPATQVDDQAVLKVDKLVAFSDVERKAYNKAAQDCMVQHGHAPRENYPELSLRSVRQLVIPRALSVEEARTYGYISSTEQKRGENGTHSVREVELSEAEYKDFAAGSEGQDNSCQAQALTRVYGNEELWKNYMILDSYILPYVSAYLDSSSYSGINRQWSECMKSKSYDYSSPGAAIRSATNAKNTQELAIADTQCREGVKYEENLHEGLNAYMTTFLNENQGLMDQVAQAKKNAEANAPKILDGTVS
ncbi:MAG: hypothetical protein Q4P78_00560 [Rothia sp. (in: high G+C Gram-positive bacteria)]|uniref:hypothetical protein n=1 Tax=Rothia sp. (in: high G+C Gram-positive bacteria) TaxID=1885016 RepID=UPI0026DF753E|nr:hypothetical protein [Rothia sp. (in: high G+C Gram-positive bacteria)]MDO5749681.1 hypothetical protein [Rothia sp. (in: high G+C Gram-positive bacteria)]